MVDWQWCNKFSIYDNFAKVNEDLIENSLELLQLILDFFMPYRSENNLMHVFFKKINRFFLDKAVKFDIFFRKFLLDFLQAEGQCNYNEYFQGFYRRDGSQDRSRQDTCDNACTRLTEKIQKKQSYKRSLIFLIIFSMHFIDVLCTNITTTETAKQKSPLVKIKLSKSLFNNGDKVKIYDENYFENKKSTNKVSINEKKISTETKTSTATDSIQKKDTITIKPDSLLEEDTTPENISKRDVSMDSIDNDIQKRDTITKTNSDRFLENDDPDDTDIKSYTSKTSTRRLDTDNKRKKTYATKYRKQLDDTDDDAQDLLADWYVYFADGLRKPDELGKNPKLTDILTWMSDNVSYIYLYPQDEMNSQKIKINISKEKSDDTIKHSADIFSILNDDEIQNAIKRARRAINIASQHIKNKSKYGANEIDYYCHLMLEITNAMKAYAELRTMLNLKFIAVSTISVPNVNESLLYTIYTKIFTTILSKVKTISDIKNVIKQI